VAEPHHRLSSRKDRDFRISHCTGLTATELESELFGHEPGVFSWAVERRAGQFELGDGGTLYLDETAVLTPLLQSKVLRFLEDQQVFRLGGGKPLSADVRLLGGASRPLLQKVDEGVFRSDLFYR